MGGIRSAGFESLTQKLMQLIVNSLLETNLGMPYAYILFILYTSWFTERLQKRAEPLGFTQRIAENNREQ